MKILVVGAGQTGDATLVAKVLDKLHTDFVVDEVIRGADENTDSVDRTVDQWCRDEGVAQRIFEVVWKDDAKNQVWGDSVFRRNVRMLAYGPDLIVLFASFDEGAAPFLNPRLMVRPVLVVEPTGEVRTRGRGWGEFVRARLAEGARGASGPRMNETAQAKMEPSTL